MFFILDWPKILLFGEELKIAKAFILCRPVLTVWVDISQDFSPNVLRPFSQRMAQLVLFPCVKVSNRNKHTVAERG